MKPSQTLLYLTILTVTNANYIGDSSETFDWEPHSPFDDFDGGTFYPHSSEHTNNLSSDDYNFNHTPQPEIPPEENIHGVDPGFNDRLSLLQDKFGFSPFLRAFLKYFVKNRYQRERREVDEYSYYNELHEDYKRGREDYEKERPHHFHPIPVFAK